ncbi:hypothetical protein PDIDSM_4144 [Penicillium digitatum]|nr:hypothetical protein PDIDSM_4144 [Penicillium digitatum]
MSHNDFVDWWLETDYGRKSKLKWDSNRHTEIWNSYHQVAQGIDGAPKVMCKRCGKILEHPYTLSPNSTGKAQYHGTSTIQNIGKRLVVYGRKRGRKRRLQTSYNEREKFQQAYPSYKKIGRRISSNFLLSTGSHSI